LADYDLVVIGGGLAGLTAGLFGARLGRSTLVLVADIPGGHLANIEHVEDFPGFPESIAGFELGPKLQEQAANAGADFRMAEAKRLVPRPSQGERLGEGTPSIDCEWLVTADEDISARAVILATGSRPRKLGVPGEEQFEGQGISHCASCDGPLLRGGPAVVVGGGDSAFQEALTLADHTSDVTLVHRFETGLAQEVYQERVRSSSSIKVLPSTDVLEIVGDEAISAVRVVHEDTREETLLPAAGVWVYAGLSPNSDIVRELLTPNQTGHIPTDIWLRTALRGVFAAGDVRAESASQAITAAGDGATAAIAADRYLELGGWPASVGTTLS